MMVLVKRVTSKRFDIILVGKWLFYKRYARKKNILPIRKFFFQLTTEKIHRTKAILLNTKQQYTFFVSTIVIFHLLNSMKNLVGISKT